MEDVVTQDFFFHPNLLSLKTSAENGCEFCSLCWRSLQSNDGAQLSSLLRNESVWAEGETWTPTIWLRGENFFDSGCSGAKVYVSCGISAGVFIDGKREPNWNPSPSVNAVLEVYEYVPEHGTAPPWPVGY